MINELSWEVTWVSGRFPGDQCRPESCGKTKEFLFPLVLLDRPFIHAVRFGLVYRYCRSKSSVGND